MCLGRWPVRLGGRTNGAARSRRTIHVRLDDASAAALEIVRADAERLGRSAGRLETRELRSVDEALMFAAKSSGSQRREVHAATSRAAPVRQQGTVEAARSGAHAEGERLSTRAVEVAATIDMYKSKARAHEWHARTLAIVGKPDEAREAASTARAIYMAKGDVPASARASELVDSLAGKS